jgi:hypothetical protein
MKTHKITILFLAATLTFSSCSKWLDVTPPSQIREEDQFSTVEGFQQALIGCYIGMTNTSLYGKTLTWSTIELMAGQYVQPLSLASDYNMSVYNYKYTTSITTINNIWLKAYTVIANANNALKYIELKKDILDNINYKIIKGELLAIRAFMHFDLMRIYGYGNLANRNDITSKYAVPYVTTLSKDMTPQLNYSQTFGLIIKDLTDAMALLENEDPVTKVHPDTYYDNVNSEGFYDNRQQRFNYYATALLLARVYLWEGSSSSLSKALPLANKVISDAESREIISWTTSTSVTSDIIMKSEHLMSLNTQNLSQITPIFFLVQILATDYNALYVSSDRLYSVYEAEGVGNTDFRFTKQFIGNTAIVNGKTSYTPLKYYGTYSGKMSNDFIPLLRIPEAYYIAAECLLKQSSPDVNGALNLLNTVRAKRGITVNLSGLNASSAMNEVIKEYLKEYYSEGYAFFLYKRLGITTIPNYSKTAGDDVYVLPYPETEIQMGRTQ